MYGKEWEGDESGTKLNGIEVKRSQMPKKTQRTANANFISGCYLTMHGLDNVYK